MSDNIITPDGAPSECRFHLASVCILSAPLHLDRPFDYLVYYPMDVKRGDLVAVPFGGGNRPETALVFKVTPVTEIEGELKYKPISKVLDRAFSLSDEAMALVELLKERTFCTTGEAVRCITPSAAFSKLEELIVCCGPLNQFYSEDTPEYQFYHFVAEHKRCTRSALSDAFGQRMPKLLSKLVNEEALAVEIGARDVSNVKYTTCYSTHLTEDEINSIHFRSMKHKEILDFVYDNGSCEQSEITAAVGVSTAQIKALVEKGLLNAETRELYRIPYSSGKETAKITLNEAQSEAAKTVIKLTESGEPKAALLYGVTGSGKTQVMRAVMEEVIRKGRGVILLVPEISLTPQTISFFSASFGERTAVIHSGLSAGERFDAWRRIKKGEVDVCIGTRSAIFAPFENLGLIVIDEEQEHTYKSDSSPKYNAKDVAAFRCGRHNCTLLLASATPSIESYHKAVTGAYTLCELPSRYGSGGIPKTDIVDMRTETKDGNFSLFSTRLVDALAKNLDEGKQSILFLNRRGYHSFMSCPSCGEVFMCPHCSVSLTHHFSRRIENGYLLCHYCGYKASVPKECPKCSNKNMRFMGYGTQLAEEQIKKLFPSARVLRMDADTTTGKFSYDDILASFRNKEADILLGTQMVTKGHDFPYVTLVGMLSADQSLFVDDYRANERTFSLICQTVGRAGRRDEEGCALIQCYSPDHTVLEVARAQDYRAFYDNEILIRRSLVFPPFCDIAAITVTCDNEGNAYMAANKLLTHIKGLLTKGFEDVKLQIFGPFEAPVYKLNEKFRVRLVIKCKNTKKTRLLFRTALKTFGDTMPKTITVGIDINPTSL